MNMISKFWLKVCSRGILRNPRWNTIVAYGGQKVLALPRNTAHRKREQCKHSKTPEGRTLTESLTCRHPPSSIEKSNRLQIFWEWICVLSLTQGRAAALRTIVLSLHTSHPRLGSARAWSWSAPILPSFLPSQHIPPPLDCGLSPQPESLCSCRQAAAFTTDERAALS